jgi:hypothetical protein
MQVFTSEDVDLFVVVCDGNDKLPEKTRPSHNGGAARGDNSLIGRGGNSFENLFQTLRDTFGVSTVIFNEKALDCGRSGPLQFAQTGPAFQEFGRDIGADLIS